MRHLQVRFLILAGTVAILSGASAHAATSCAALANLGLPDNTVITSASTPQLPFTTPDAPLAFGGTATVDTPFCRVVAVARPVSDSVINIEVWLPTTGWNERFKGSAAAARAGDFHTAR